MPEESKEVDSKVEEEAIDEVVNSQVSILTDNENNDVDEEKPEDGTTTEAVAASSNAKKKKSKKAKIKKALGVGGIEDETAESSNSAANPASKLTTGMVEQLLEMNPSLKSEVAGMDKEKAAETLKKLDVADLLTGMVIIASTYSVARLIS